MAVYHDLDRAKSFGGLWEDLYGVKRPPKQPALDEESPLEFASDGHDQSSHLTRVAHMRSLRCANLEGSAPIIRVRPRTAALHLLQLQSCHRAIGRHVERGRCASARASAQRAVAMTEDRRFPPFWAPKPGAIAQDARRCTDATCLAGIRGGTDVIWLNSLSAHRLPLDESRCVEFAVVMRLRIIVC